MSEIQTIINIRNAKNTIKDNIKKIDLHSYEGQNFGEEAEYTYKGLMGGIDSLLIDIATLVKAPKQFLKLSTHEERYGILNSLNSINNSLENPSHLWIYLEELKQQVRPFHIRYTNKRLISFDDELSELIKNKLDFQQNLENLKNELAAATVTKEEVLKSLKSLTTKDKELQNNIDKGNSKFEEFNNSIGDINNNATHISEIKSQSDSHKEVIDNFVAKIIKREQELENQTAKTHSFNKQLEEFTTERADLLKTAESLIEEAKTALGYKKAEGISGAFQTQLDNRSNGNKWLWGAGFSILIAIGLTAWFIYLNPSIDLETTLARISLLVLPLTSVWFCAGQYTKLKNIAEDYAYKTMLVQSIIGFSEQLKNDDGRDTSYQNYMERILDEIHQHPLKNHKKQEQITSYKKIAEHIKNLVSKDNT